jgi:hypothetical protein
MSGRNMDSELGHRGTPLIGALCRWAAEIRYYAL